MLDQILGDELLEPDYPFFGRQRWRQCKLEPDEIRHMGLNEIGAWINRLNRRCESDMTVSDQGYGVGYLLSRLRIRQEALRLDPYSVWKVEET